MLTLLQVGSRCLVFALGMLVLGCATTKTEGPIPWEEVQSVLARYEPESRACYVRAVRGRIERPVGSVAVAFEIERDGRVRNASVTDSTIGLPLVEKCLLSLLAKIPFRQDPRSLTRATHSFKFTRDLVVLPE